MRQFKRLSVPQNVHPLVKRLFEEMNKEQIGMLDMSERTGVSKDTIFAWKRRAVPNIVNLEACFTVLGKKLSIQNAERD